MKKLSINKYVENISNIDSEMIKKRLIKIIHEPWEHKTNTKETSAKSS